MPGLEVVDGASTYTFSFALTPRTQDRVYTIDSRPWEPRDGQTYWRKALHPWDGGVSADRLGNEESRSYHSGNCDAAFAGHLLHPPLVTALSAFTNATIAPNIHRHFNGADYFNGGRYIYKVASDYTVTEIKDFGSGKACVDFCVFNNELVFAMGESEKIYTMSTSDTFTQATNDTYAIALGVVGKLLYRAETTNLLSACTSAPRTLTSWIPSSSATKYVVGDSTFAVHSIIDYGGTVWAIKGDGAYTGDNLGQFFNQTPQIYRYADADNGKGSFVAQGALWVPSKAGLIRIRPGEALGYGPEIMSVPFTEYTVRGGVEWGDWIYLLAIAKQNSGGSNTNDAVIVRMIPDEAGVGEKEYLYHTWATVGSLTTGPKVIGISASPTAGPTMFFGTNATTGMGYIKLGSSPGGRYIDSSTYSFGTSMNLTTGQIQPVSDITAVSRLIGVEVLCRYARASDSLTVSFAVDNELGPNASYSNLLDNAESGSGTAAITSTSGWDTVVRYAPTDTTAVGQTFSFTFTGTFVTACTGTTSNRPGIREAWAYGTSHPKRTDVITMGLTSEARAITTDGVRVLSSTDMINLWRSWAASSKALSMILEGYEKGHTTRFVVTDVRFDSDTTIPGAGLKPEQIYAMTVVLTRCDFSGQYAT